MKPYSDLIAAINALEFASGPACVLFQSSEHLFEIESRIDERFVPRIEFTVHTLSGIPVGPGALDEKSAAALSNLQNVYAGATR